MFRTHANKCVRTIHKKAHVPKEEIEIISDPRFRKAIEDINVGKTRRYKSLAEARRKLRL